MAFPAFTCVLSSIKLTIKASDGGVPSLSTETTLTIAIMDTNDHAPTILLTPCQTSPTEPNGKNWAIFRSVLIITFFYYSRRCQRERATGRLCRLVQRLRFGSRAERQDGHSNRAGQSVSFGRQWRPDRDQCCLWSRGTVELRVDGDCVWSGPAKEVWNARTIDMTLEWWMMQPH